ncbi:serine hydrolase [Pseudoflavitalea sp. G-6-1-2]|uniref:serine hydrolase n=1 Tax=Pseudoflavitalea sp. G-6-1-2 TaxID=2728841 RepID=UPI001F0E0590|nr:serine hydrolase [Pseudoflavitalea sp. G-6-1-2]
MKKSIETILSNQPGHYAVAFRDLSSGEELFIHADESFHAASTMKTPVMIEVFKQAAAGRFSLNDSFTVKNQFKSIVDGSPYQLDSTDDSDKDIYNNIGKPLPLRQLVRDMIIKSSNLATNMVIELAGATNVMQTMREIGAMDIHVLRGVEDNKAYQQGLNNTTTAADLLLIFTRMAEGKLVSREASNQMIEILLDQHFNSVLPAQLPKEVKVAHKTGNINGVEHDGGIVMLPNGKQYVLILLSRDLPDSEQGKQLLSRISAAVYSHVTAHP